MVGLEFEFTQLENFNSWAILLLSYHTNGDSIRLKTCQAVLTTGTVKLSSSNTIFPLSWQCP